MESAQHRLRVPGKDASMLHQVLKRPCCTIRGTRWRRPGGPELLLFFAMESDPAGMWLNQSASAHPHRCRGLRPA